MKIKSVRRVSYRLIQTDADTHPTYRRSSDGDWENLVDGEWQPCESQQKRLERMYQDHVLVLGYSRGEVATASDDDEIQAQGFHGTR